MLKYFRCKNYEHKDYSSCGCGRVYSFSPAERCGLSVSLSKSFPVRYVPTSRHTLPRLRYRTSGTGVVAFKRSQSIYAQYAQQYSQITQQSPIERILPIAATESANTASVFNIKAKILYWRNQNMTLSYNLTTYSSGWESVNP